MITLEQIERELAENLGEGWDVLCERHGIDPGVGLYCGELARAALRAMGIPDDQHAELQRLGAALTNACMCGFEAALRAKELTSTTLDADQMAALVAWADEHHYDQIPAALVSVIDRFEAMA